MTAPDTRRALWDGAHAARVEHERVCRTVWWACDEHRRLHGDFIELHTLIQDEIERIRKSNGGAP